MIHGHTKIELYNANTRIRKVTESDNIFQSAVLARYMRGLGEANNNPFANSTFAGAKPWENLVGGLFLFRDSITEGTEFMPAGNQMIGNGSFGVSSGELETDPPEMGSYNATESSATGSAITQVYDFSTEQANGTIGCVCLTSQVGGYIGYGNASGKVKANRYSLFRNQTAVQVNRSNTQLSNDFAVLGNTKYDFTVASGVVTVTKTRLSITRGSVFDGFSTSQTFDLSEVGNHLGITSENLMTSLDGTDIYLIPNKGQGVAASATGYIYKYDTTNDTLTEISFVNSSTKTINISTGRGIKCKISNGCLFAVNADSKISVFNLSTSALITELNIYAYGGAWQNYVGGYYGQGLTILTDENNPQLKYLYDHSSDIARFINATDIAFFDRATGCLERIDGVNTFLYKNPLYLATINNIQPVTKTAAQTMKVTYTLTEV